MSWAGKENKGWEEGWEKEEMRMPLAVTLGSFQAGLQNRHPCLVLAFQPLTALGTFPSALRALRAALC